MTASATIPLFRDDAYLRDCDAQVIGVNDLGGIILDRTVFFATGGGQPGDTGRLVVDGVAVPIATTVYTPGTSEIVHVPASAPTRRPEAGMRVRAELAWERRQRHMRMHTALHLLCALIKFPVTGGSIGAEESRLDFDISDADAVDRDSLTEQLNALVQADHPVSMHWISDEELLANPGLVRTMSVKPPTGSGRVRLIAIGEDGSIDLQPCGGTHVASTGEIGRIDVRKIEKKGRQNRRIRIGFAENT